jgi:hypothetical protein
MLATGATKKDDAGAALILAGDEPSDALAVIRGRPLAQRLRNYADQDDCKEDEGLQKDLRQAANEVARSDTRRLIDKTLLFVAFTCFALAQLAFGRKLGETVEHDFIPPILWFVLFDEGVKAIIRLTSPDQRTVPMVAAPALAATGCALAIAKVSGGLIAPASTFAGSLAAKSIIFGLKARSADAGPADKATAIASVVGSLGSVALAVGAKVESHLVSGIGAAAGAAAAGADLVMDIATTCRSSTPAVVPATAPRP